MWEIPYYGIITVVNTYFMVSRNFLLLSISSGILLRIFFKLEDLRLSSRKGSSVLAILNSTK